MHRITKKRVALFFLIFALAIFVWHIIVANTVIYTPKYQREDISDLVKKNNISDDDYMKIYEQTGVSPYAAKKMIESGDYAALQQLNETYFDVQEIEKIFIAYPITLEERNKEQKTPIADLEKGDILVTFNTHTMGWRHGHCAIVLDENADTLLEHMSIGNVSCKTSPVSWEMYPSFVVLRHKDKEIAQNAAEYAEKNLVEIPYNILAGVIKKDKTGEENPSSHCSHIVWQAYKSQGVDLDNNKGIFVTPKDIALSEELEVVQIYGINPKKYVDRIKK